MLHLFPDIHFCPVFPLLLNRNKKKSGKAFIDKTCGFLLSFLKLWRKIKKKTYSLNNGPGLVPCHLPHARAGLFVCTAHHKGGPRVYVVYQPRAGFVSTAAPRPPPPRPVRVLFHYRNKTKT